MQSLCLYYDVGDKTLRKVSGEDREAHLPRRRDRKTVVNLLSRIWCLILVDNYRLKDGAK